VKEYLDNEPFFLTYGDGVANVNIKEELAFHKAHQKLITVAAVQPSGRFGALNMGADDSVHSFTEKPKGDGAWINGGFFICEPQVIDYLSNDTTIFEREPLENLAKDNQMVAFKHTGFWKPMDTLRDKQELETAWESGNADWKIW
jgi:glucose-1-phosphate cytidylyltransferase